MEHQEQTTEKYPAVASEHIGYTEHVQIPRCNGL